MTRHEEIIKAANEYVIKTHSPSTNEFQTAMNIAVVKAYIASAEWMQNTMIDKACEILENVTVTYNRIFFGKCEENAFDADFIKEFRRILEE